MTTIQIHPVAYVFTDDEDLLTIAEDHSVVGTRYCLSIEDAISSIENLEPDEVHPEEMKLLNVLKDCVKQGCSGDAMFFGE